MNTLSEADSFISSADPNSQFLDPFTTASSYEDGLEAITNDVAGRDYALCAKPGRDALVAAMNAYQGYMLERALSESEYSASDYPPEQVAERLEHARRLMRQAAGDIEDATGQDVSFLLQDGIAE